MTMLEVKNEKIHLERNSMELISLELGVAITIMALARADGEQKLQCG
jgi:hypothetical protein